MATDTTANGRRHTDVQLRPLLFLVTMALLLHAMCPRYVIEPRFGGPTMFMGGEPAMFYRVDRWTGTEAAYYNSQGRSNVDWLKVQIAPLQ